MSNSKKYEAMAIETQRLLLGLGSVSIYIEDRYPEQDEGYAGKYKVFLTFRVLWVRKTFTFRIAYLGYFVPL
jgi:hypothetical protein